MSDVKLPATEYDELELAREISETVSGLDGVSCIDGGSLTQTITNTVLRREPVIPGIWIDNEDDENALNVTVQIKVYYGVNIPQLSFDIQVGLKKLLEEKDLLIKNINISVVGIDRKED